MIGRFVTRAECNPTQVGRCSLQFHSQDLPDEVKEAAKTLGYNKKSWDNDGKIALDENDWEGKRLLIR